MNREDIIRMARNANCIATGASLERFAALVAAAEREACAELCETLDAHPATAWPSDCAAAIRKRAEQ